MYIMDALHRNLSSSSYIDSDPDDLYTNPKPPPKPKPVPGILPKVISSDFIDRSRLVALLKILNQKADEPKIVRRPQYWIIYESHTPTDVSCCNSLGTENAE